MDGVLKDFMGLTLDEAQTLAQTMGLTVRDRTEPGWYTTSDDPGRLNLWLDKDGRVRRAERH
jgi:hypothetical protein